jgi:hypothetical protein
MLNKGKEKTSSKESTPKIKEKTPTEIFKEKSPKFKESTPKIKENSPTDKFKESTPKIKENSPTDKFKIKEKSPTSNLKESTPKIKEKSPTDKFKETETPTTKKREVFSEQTLVVEQQSSDEEQEKTPKIERIFDPDATQIVNFDMEEEEEEGEKTYPEYSLAIPPIGIKNNFDFEKGSNICLDLIKIFLKEKTEEKLKIYLLIDEDDELLYEKFKRVNSLKITIEITRRL